MKITPELLDEVAHDNNRTNQIGDNIVDGVSREVGEDLGYLRPEDISKLTISPEAAQTVAPNVGRTALSNAEQIRNARRAEAKARQHRRNSGF